MSPEAKPALALVGSNSSVATQEKYNSPDKTSFSEWKIVLPTRSLSTRLDFENSGALATICAGVERRQHRLSKNQKEGPHTESLVVLWQNWEEISSGLYTPKTHFFLKPQCFVEVALTTPERHFGQVDIIGITGTGDVIVLEIGRNTEKSDQVRKYINGMRAIFDGNTERVNLYPFVANYSNKTIPKEIVIKYPQKPKD